MEFRDDELLIFEAEGAAALPRAETEGFVAREGARIRYAVYGAGAPVVLLHGGLGHGGNWGHQVPALAAAGYRPILIDARGHGRSTRDARPFTYELMASDAEAVMEALGVARAPVIGWSDGACTGLVLAMQSPARVSGVFFFGCNMDPSGTKEIDEANPLIGRCFARHAKDYAALSATPDAFMDFVAAVNHMMKTEPNYGAEELGRIRLPAAIVQSEFDEFIRPEHADYLAASIPGAKLVRLAGVGHFAPLQRPALFNRAMLAFLAAPR